jgi:sugar lactone lactonase YvrE
MKAWSASAGCVCAFILMISTACLAAGLEVVAELSVGPGNITVTPQNRIIVSLHPFYSPDMRVAELTPAGKLTPFPDESWNRRDGKAEHSFDSVLGIQCDANGVVWMLDNGLRTGSFPKLVAWDTVANRLFRIIQLKPPIVPSQPMFPDNAFFNDLAVDLTHRTVYISHSAGVEDSALIVVNLDTGQARRILQGDASMVPENLNLVMDGRVLNFTLPDAGRLKLLIGVNPIALDATDEWLYFGTMNGTSMFRIRTSDLNDAHLTHGQLAQRVERYSDKPICDGISVDNAGNIYISDLQTKSIGVITPTRHYRTIVTDPRISWPESFSFGPDGYLYFVASQLHLSAPLNEGVKKSQPPFYVFRIKPLAPGVVGR